MNEMQRVFTYENQPMRTIMKGEDVWIVAKDICDILEIENVSQAVNRLPDKTKDTICFNDSEGKPHKLLVISEPGFYRLTLSSNKPKAENFVNWVTEDVIPSIRKTGGYFVTENPKIAIMQKREERLRERLNLEKAKFFETLLDKYGNELPKESKQFYLSETSISLFNKAMVEKPKVDKTYSALEIGKEIGLSENMIGRIANRYNLKTEEYSEMILNTKKHSKNNDPVKTYQYNEKGKQKIIECAKLEGKI